MQDIEKQVNSSLLRQDLIAGQGVVLFDLLAIKGYSTLLFAPHLYI